MAGQRRAWWLRDLIYLVVFVAVLIGITYLLDYAESFYPAIRYYHRILVMMGINITLAVSLNIINGHAGQFSLGHAGFMAIGAYFAAFLSVYYLAPYVEKFPETTTAHWLLQNAMLVLAVVLGGAFAALSGYVVGLPSLRLRGDYLAIVTLGFGEIVPAVFLNADKLTNGTNGIGGIHKPSLMGFTFTLLNPVPYYIAMVAILAVTMVFMYRLLDSRLGRAWMAIREDELAAASSGINTVTTKLLAFALGASTAGLAGVFTAAKLTIVSPDQFSFAVSFTVLAMVVLGGMGNVWGVAVGAFVIYTIQSVLLKQLNQFFHTVNLPILKDIDFVQYQFLLYGLALVAMMLLRPEGLFPSSRRKRELHEASEEVADVPPPMEALSG